MNIDTSRLVRFAGPVLLILAIVILGPRLMNPDEWRINKRLSKLRALVAKDADEGKIATLARTREIMNYFVDDPEINLGQSLPTITSRDELAAVVHHVRTSAKSIRVSIKDKELTIDKEAGSAMMDLTVETVVTVTGDTGKEIRQIAVEWRKQDDDWFVAEVTPIETIRRPPAE